MPKAKIFILSDFNNINALITLLAKLFNNNWEQEKRYLYF